MPLTRWERVQGAISRAKSSNVARILTANFFTQGIGLAITFLASAILGVEQFAVLVAMQIWLGVVPPLMAFGVPDALVVSHDEGLDLPRLYASGFLATMMTSAIGATIAYALFRQVLYVDAGTALVAGATVIVTLASGWAASLEQRLKRFGLYNRLMIVGNLATLAATAVAAFAPELQNASYMLGARLLGLSVPLVIRLVVRRRFLASPRWSVAISVLRLGARFHVSALLNTVSMRLDQIISAQLLAPNSLAALGLILPFSNANRSVGQAVGTVRLVSASQAGLSARNRIREIERSARVAQIAGAGLAILLVGTFALVLHLAANLEAGLPKLSWETLSAALLYLIAASLASTADVLIRLHRAVEVVRYGIASRSLAILSTAGLAIVLIPSLGLIGASITVLVTSAISSVVMWRGTVRLGKEP